MITEQKKEKVRGMALDFLDEIKGGSEADEAAFQTYLQKMGNKKAKVTGGLVYRNPPCQPIPYSQAIKVAKRAVKVMELRG